MAGSLDFDLLVLSPEKA